MAVKASITITISKYRDCDSITRYYKLQASTAAAPAIPTTLNPSGWSTAEPTYTSGSTNTLYYTDCYIFSDGTFQYTDDGNGKAVKSSSYEAAKGAYNKAQAAQDTANATQTNLNNMQIGGTNLCVGTKLMPTNTQTLKPYSMYFSYNNNINTIELEDNFRAVHITTNDSWKGITCKEFNRLEPKVNEEYIIQTMIKSSGYTGEIGFYAMIYDSNNTKKTGSYFYLEKPDGTHTNSYYIATILSLSDNINEKLWLKLKPTQLLIDLINAGGHVELSFQTHDLAKNSNDGYINFWKMKLEKGNKPTDWTPAPEDTESNIKTIETQVNNIQIGGRNLLLNSKTLPGKTGTNIDNDGFSEGYTTGDGTWNEKQYWWSINANDNPLTGKQVCISLDFKTDDITKINKMAFSIGTYASNKSTRKGDYNLYVTNYKTIDGTNLENDKWKRIYCVATIPSSFTHSDARYYALQTKIAYDAGTPTMYYKKIKIELGNKPTDWSPAPEDTESNIETQINNIQIGGTNLLRGTNTVTSLGSSSAWSNGTWRNAGGGTGTRTSISVSNAPNANIKVGWSTTSTSGQVLISQDNVPMTNGEKYILSCYAKGTGSILLQYGNGTVGYTGSNIQITDENNWKKYVYTFTSRGTANIYLGSNAAGNNVSFCGMKLESGNKATDWSPAPEDIQTDMDDIRSTYLKETTFTNYKSDQIKKDNTFEQRIKQTSVTMYGNDDGTIDPDAGEALVNRLNKVDNDLNGENGALDRIEAAEGTLEGTGLNEYDQAIKITQRFLNVETDVDQIKNMFKITGGTNLIQNSVGYFTDKTGKPTMWNIAANTIYTPFGYDGDLVGVTISRGKLFCAKGSMTTTQNNIMTLLANKKMSISFKYKNGANATSKVKIFNGSVTFFEKTFNSTVNSWTEVIATFDCTVNSLQITIESTNTTNNNGILISDLMLNYGDVKPWELCSNEVYGAMVKLSGLGIEVTATTAHTKNFMTTDGILVYEYDSEHDIVGNLITKITDDGILTNQLESTGDIIERNLVHTMIKDSANHNVYVEYIR